MRRGREKDMRIMVVEGEIDRLWTEEIQIPLVSWDGLCLEICADRSRKTNAKAAEDPAHVS